MRLCNLALVLILPLSAASPVATVTSGTPFQLRGAPVNPNGVPSWPVMAGDEIKTENGDATIRFFDGSQITLGARSQARVEQVDNSAVFRLLQGDVDVRPAAKSTLQVFNNSKLVTAPAGTVTHASTNPSKTGSRVSTLGRLPPPPPVTSK